MGRFPGVALACAKELLARWISVSVALMTAKAVDVAFIT